MKRMLFTFWNVQILFEGDERIIQYIRQWVSVHNEISLQSMYQIVKFYNVKAYSRWLLPNYILSTTAFNLMLWKDGLKLKRRKYEI